MSDDFLSLKILIVSEVAAERDRVRHAASQASVPVEIAEIENVGDSAETCERLARDTFDIVFFDSRMSRAGRQEVLDAARAANGRPLVILIGPADLKSREVITEGLAVDGALAKPIDPGEAGAMMDRCVRARMPNRVLIVDDSSTVRTVVRKVLQASRFRIEAEEAAEGAAALEQASKQHFDIVFLDCNMPGLDGFATLTELKRDYPNIKVVMITGTNDVTIADRALASGASDFLFKPFFAKDIDALLNRLFGLMSPKTG